MQGKRIVILLVVTEHHFIGVLGVETETFVFTFVTSNLFLPLNLGRPIPCPEPVKLQIYSVGFKEYEKHCYDLSQLRETCEY